MANMYREMGNFLTEAFEIDNPAKKKLNESFWDSEGPKSGDAQLPGENIYVQYYLDGDQWCVTATEDGDELETEYFSANSPEEAASKAEAIVKGWFY